LADFYENLDLLGNEAFFELWEDSYFVDKDSSGKWIENTAEFSQYHIKSGVMQLCRAIKNDQKAETEVYVKELVNCFVGLDLIDNDEIFAYCQQVLFEGVFVAKELNDYCEINGEGTQVYGANLKCEFDTILMQVGVVEIHFNANDMKIEISTKSKTPDFKITRLLQQFDGSTVFGVSEFIAHELIRLGVLCRELDLDLLQEQRDTQ